MLDDMLFFIILSSLYVGIHQSPWPNYTCMLHWRRNEKNICMLHWRRNEEKQPGWKVRSNVRNFWYSKKTGMLCYMSCTLAKVVSDDPSPVNIHSHMNFEFPCLHSSCSLWIDVKYWYILWSDFICYECHSLNMC